MKNISKNAVLKGAEEKSKDFRKQTGNSGEDRAASYLEENGFKVISRNFRTRNGEIDIIAEKGKIVLFVEVKTLPNGTPELLEKVLDKRKQKRIVKTAKFFLAKHREYNDNYIRFDVIVNDLPGFPPVYHIENAFAELL